MARIISILLVLIYYSSNAQIQEPKVIYKDEDPIISETLAGIVDFNKGGIYQNKRIYSLWMDNCVLYFGEIASAQLFSFVKISYRKQEYFVFKKMSIDSLSSDSILNLYQTIRNYPSSTYIKDWQLSVDGKLYQIEAFNDKMDYQLKTFSGIASNLKICPEALSLNNFFEMTVRIIATQLEEQLAIPYNDFYIDYSTGRFVPRITKDTFIILKKQNDIVLKKTTANK